MPTTSETPRVAYRKILYATDLSEKGRVAFPHAASLAHHYDAELTVFHVIEHPHFEKYLVGYMSDALWNEIRTRNLQDAKKLLVGRKRADAAIREAVDRSCQSALEDSDHPYVEYSIVVKEGQNAEEEIINEAHSGGYDLVVIGKQGQGAVEDALMGSTTWRVLHHCKVPVMVVRIAEE